MTDARIRYNGDFQDREARIKVIGVGGGGGNAVNRMVEADIRMVDFISLNTDAQDLRRNKAPSRVQIGETLTKGLGVGGDPARGRQAALESEELVKEAVSDADLIFITAGMGGGTGTGAAPVVAQLAKETSSALVIGVVTRPFEFEGTVRANQADQGIHEMRKHVDSLLVIPNDRLRDIVGSDTAATEAYRIADDVLRQAIQGIADVITTAGLINVDFQDVRKIMTKSGEALIGIGQASGEKRHLDAASQAIHSPMLENAVIDGAKGILVNFTSARNLKLSEIQEAMEYIRKSSNPDAFIKFGQADDDAVGDALKITVIATGFPSRPKTDLSIDLERHRHKKRPRPAGDFFDSIDGPNMINSGMPDEDLDRPAFMRRKTGGRRLK
ncbi:MAG: cell division protein FtsZ [Elusimicrobia bacterium GWA2_56_46]|jgi:cell division protein FtsZ|nr:MAG: cell division protein FtsZ [Elusimicrobia bacterium GWA2_56_46]OGR54808.1 MAG: cell division protein FtsZ [Elusimicrobia bacterium GWC2_56_31]HBB66218.1 cell division protein FtsZ [Elusimicrobiota bacterium]HBW23401.1 cell division protein FtsZ [Elusimicrobiota bacterium]